MSAFTAPPRPPGISDGCGRPDLGRRDLGRPDASGRGTGRWSRTDSRSLARPLGVVAALHLLGWGALAVIAPTGYHLAGEVSGGRTGGGQFGGQVFGWGLGLTAYAFGMRHAFDADHIAVIDGATRKLTADQAARRTAGSQGPPASAGSVSRPLSVGFWFSLGHSSVVFAMALFAAAGARFAATLVRGDSTIHQALATFGTSAAGLLLWIIGLVNLTSLLAIMRLRRRLHRGQLSEQELQECLQVPGVMARLLGPLTRRIRSPRQAYPAGLVMGLGFDTATEVALLVLAGTAALTAPWYAVLALPVLFAAGMSLFDTLDGAFMHLAYDWAYGDNAAFPLRRLNYNAAVTGLSMALALGIGTIQLTALAHQRLARTDPITTWIAGVDTSVAGFVIVAAFATAWGAALLWSRRARPASTAPAGPPSQGGQR